MRLSFLPAEDRVIITTLPSSSVHAILGEVLDLKQRPKWWEIFNDVLDSSYLGSGNEFSLDREVRLGKGQMTITAWGSLEEHSGKTVVRIGYRGYSTLTNIFCWVCSLAGVLIFLMTIGDLIAHYTLQGQLVQLLLILPFLGIPQVTRLILSSKVDELHRLIITTIIAGQKKAVRH